MYTCHAALQKLLYIAYYQAASVPTTMFSVQILQL